VVSTKSDRIGIIGYGNCLNLAQKDRKYAKRHWTWYKVYLPCRIFYC